MSPDRRIVRFIGRHHVMTIATAVEGQSPWCANVFYCYVEPENIFVFTSSDSTRHATEMTANDFVGASIVLETKLIGKVQGLQIQGRVIPLDRQTQRVTGPLDLQTRQAGLLDPAPQCMTILDPGKHCMTQLGHQMHSTLKFGPQTQHMAAPLDPQTQYTLPLDPRIQRAARKAYIRRFPYAAALPLSLWILRPTLLKLTDNRLGFARKLTWLAE